MKIVDAIGYITPQGLGPLAAFVLGYVYFRV